jgi:hypothetical protein
MVDLEKFAQQVALASAASQAMSSNGGSSIVLYLEYPLTSWRVHSAFRPAVEFGC